jgi:hypothetical protein
MLSIPELRKEFGRAIFIDGARWCMDACKWLRLKHQVYATELTLRDRTESFDHFLCRSESCNRQYFTNCIKMFILYLHMKMDGIKLMKFLVENS